ncbi:MAG: GNAT family N-acetyltransferase [Pyrinomonadaceae bacterium]
MLRIREYKPEDSGCVEACYVELQDNERRLEPIRAEGRAVAEKYLARMFARSAETGGAVFVAEVEERVVGFVCVWGRITVDELINDESEFAYVSDLVVTNDYRGRGIGHALLERAEAFAVQSGARRLRLGVLAKNESARKLYEKFGFSDFEVVMIKTLRDG